MPKVANAAQSGLCKEASPETLQKPESRNETPVVLQLVLLWLQEVFGLGGVGFGVH